MNTTVRPTHRQLIGLARDGQIVFHGDGYAFRVKVMRGRRLTSRYDAMSERQFNCFDELVQAGVLIPAPRDKPVVLNEDAAHAFLRGQLADPEQ